MKLSELVKDEKYANREVDLNKVEELLFPVKPKTIYDLKYDDTYFVIERRQSDGKLVIEECKVKCKDILENDILFNNAFLTYEEAEFEVERRKVIQELKRFSKEFEYNENNRNIAFDFSEEEIFYDCNNILQYPYIYFESKEKAQEAVKSVGEDRVIKYYLGVNDESNK
jgi:hypothetical protein